MSMGDVGRGAHYRLSGVVVPAILRIVVEVRATGPPHVVRLWLVLSNGMLPLKYFRSNKASLCLRP